MNHSQHFVAALILWGGSCIVGDLATHGQTTTVFQTPSTLRLSQHESSEDQGPNARHSLGDMLRDRADELGQDEPTESLREPSDDMGYDADASEEETDALRNRSTLAHLMRLRKPVREIKIEATESRGPVPENRAALSAQQDPLIVIAAFGASTPPPDRYTVGFMHRPLYYEQPQLERCGKSCGYFQNAISGFQFLANTMVLPYRIGAQRADCPIPSGGDCLTCQTDPVDLNPLPLDRHGLVSQAASLAGFSFLLL